MLNSNTDLETLTLDTKPYTPTQDFAASVDGEPSCDLRGGYEEEQLRWILNFKDLSKMKARQGC